MGNDPIVQAIRKTACTLAGILILIAFVGLVTGCATEQRWLTKEEDAEFRKKCEGQNCVVIPGAVLQQLIERLQGTAI
jgi:hypothetical protein